MAKRSKKKKSDGGFHREWIWGALLVVAVIVAYTPVWWAGYIWDDAQVVTANTVVAGPLGLREIWTTAAADICPFTISTFWLEYQLWGDNSLAYHLVNVLLHAACAVVLWRVLLAIRVPGAFFGAALWALHPVQVESVAWISEMKNTESGLFYLLAILFFVKGLPQGKGINALTLAFSALAMTSKSSTVILPVIFLLAAWWVEGRWHWRNVIKVAPVLALSILAGLVSIWTQQAGGASSALWSRNFAERLTDAGHAIWFYLGKLVWPHPLLPIYPKSWQGFDLEWLFVLLVLAALWFARTTIARPWFFAFAYFLIAITPVLGLIDNYIFRYGIAFDHLQYLASMGPLALVGAGLAKLADRFASQKIAVQTSLASVVLLILSTLTWRQAWAYENATTYWTHLLAYNPKSEVAYNNLGIIHDKSGNIEQALDAYQKALAANPDYPEAHYNLGIIYEKQGKADEAIAQYQRAVDVYPEYPDAQNNLAIHLLRKGRADEAIIHLRKVLEMYPDETKANMNLGIALAQKGDPKEALVHLQRAAAAAPNDASAIGNLGNLLLTQGQFDEAIIRLQQSISLNPNVPEFHNALGLAFLQKHQPTNALVEFQQAIILRRNYPEAQANMTKAQAMVRSQPSPK